MPKKVVSPLIYEGHFEYLLRFALGKNAVSSHPECVGMSVCGNFIYYHKSYLKCDFTLEDVKRERQLELLKFEKLGLRNPRSKWNSTKE